MGYFRRLGSALVGDRAGSGAADHGTERAEPHFEAMDAPKVSAQSPGNPVGVDDPLFAELVAAIEKTNSGANVSVASAMRNTTVFRCVSLISYTMGMLPFQLLDAGTREKAREHPLYEILASQPNQWQTAFDFRSLMQYRSLVHGNAYALIIRGVGGRIIRLVPLPPGMVSIKQKDDWSVEYRYQPPKGGLRIFRPDQIFHLRGLSNDGLRGMSLVKQAAEAIGLAQQAEKAAGRLFAQGMIVGGALSHPEKLSPEAYERLKASMEARRGADGAQKDLILEEGMEWKTFTSTSKDSQHLEQRAFQIEEIARVFGVPRPLLGVDDTSWGSGIDVLGQMFVRYGLAPWFTAWEQAVKLSLLTPRERENVYAKFNDGALLRGSMKDQADFFAKGLGSGGHQPWMKVEEVRDLMDLENINLSDLPPPPGKQKENGNEPA